MSQARARHLVPLLLLPLALPMLFLVLVAGQATPPPPGCAPPQDPAGEPAAKQAGTAITLRQLDTEALTVAEQIVGAVRGFGPTSRKPRAAVIALATARQESGIRNLDYGDRDSLGAFQQRPSQGWGTPAEVRNVAHATTTFLRHLIAVPGWETMRVTDAAATVQRPAAQYRGLYEQWVPLATDLTRKYWDSAASLARVDARKVADTQPCTPDAFAATGPIRFPVPANLVGTDRKNWGGRGGQWSSWHTGTDFSVPCGTPVLAATAGRVEIDQSQGWAGTWLLKITTGPHALITWYAHMRRLEVTVGQVVTPGQLLGEVGDRGNTTGCHLHFEVHTRGGSIYGPDNVDPTIWLARHVGKTLNVSTGSGSGPGAFVIATFNALGHSHTAPGGDRARWPDSGPRTRALTALLTRQAPDVVGLQEFQGTQVRVFARLTGGTWDRYGNKDNVIIWRRSTFQRVSAGTVAIPYFHGNTRRMPLLRLRHLPSGRVITVINVHNPANVHGPAARWRARAITRERAAVTRERAAGHPVFLLGDLNDRRPAFCGLTQGKLVTSASGGSAGGERSGRCLPPSRMGIDWIFATGATFSNYLVDHSPQGHTSDHPYVEAIAHPETTN